MQDKFMDKTRACIIIVYAQTSHAPCDLDLQANDMVLTCKILSCHDDLLW